MNALAGTKRKEHPAKALKKSKKAKPAQIPILTPERLQTLLLNLKETVCGIDLSLASPSVAVLDPVQKVLHSYVIRQRKGDLAHNQVRITEGPMTGWLFRLTCLPEPTVAENTAMYRFARFMPILDMIMNAVGNAPTVAIESYAHAVGRFQSSSQSVLIELGAVVRWSLFRQVKRLVEVPPSQAKRVFTGLGKSTKEEMVECALKTYKLPCVHKLLGIHSDRKTVAKPVDDVIDAIAVAFCALSSK